MTNNKSSFTQHQSNTAQLPSNDTNISMDKQRNINNAPDKHNNHSSELQPSNPIPSLITSASSQSTHHYNHHSKSFLMNRKSHSSAPHNSQQLIPSVISTSSAVRTHPHASNSTNDQVKNSAPTDQPSFCASLFISNIPEPLVQSDLLQEIFACCGNIKQWKPVVDAKGKRKPFGMLEMADGEGVHTAIHLLPLLSLDVLQNPEKLMFDLESSPLKQTIDSNDNMLVPSVSNNDNTMKGIRVRMDEKTAAYMKYHYSKQPNGQMLNMQGFGNASVQDKHRFQMILDKIHSLLVSNGSSRNDGSLPSTSKDMIKSMTSSVDGKGQSIESNSIISITSDHHHDLVNTEQHSHRHEYSSHQDQLKHQEHSQHHDHSQHQEHSQHHDHRTPIAAIVKKTIASLKKPPSTSSNLKTTNIPLRNPQSLPFQQTSFDDSDDAINTESATDKGLSSNGKVLKDNSSKAGSITKCISKKDHLMNFISLVHQTCKYDFTTQCSPDQQAVCSLFSLPLKTSFQGQSDDVRYRLTVYTDGLTQRMLGIAMPQLTRLLVDAAMSLYSMSQDHHTVHNVQMNDDGMKTVHLDTLQSKTLESAESFLMDLLNRLQELMPRDVALSIMWKLRLFILLESEQLYYDKHSKEH